MEQEELDMIEELHERCGEIYLSIKGNLVFLCTICEFQTKDFDGYTDHITSAHYTLEVIEADEDAATTTAIQVDWYEENDAEEIELVPNETTYEELVDITTTTSVAADDYENIETLEESDIETKASQMEDFVYLRESDETDKNLKKENTKKRKVKSYKLDIFEQTPSLQPHATVKKRQRIPLDSAERKHKCPICGFGFRDYSNLQSHIRRHSEDKKNHVCPHCPKRFYSSTELVSHVRRHTKERPYLCTHCGRTFVTNSMLTSHTKRHLNIRNSVCTICDKSFYDNTLLKEHMVTHNGERSFQCTICDAKFARRKALVCHAKLHENKREYQCDLCPASFNQGPGLYSHLRSKHQLDKSTISNYRAIGTGLKNESE